MNEVKKSVPYTVEITMGEKTWTIERELPVLLHEDPKDDEPNSWALLPSIAFTRDFPDAVVSCVKIEDEMERLAVKIARKQHDERGA